MRYLVVLLLLLVGRALHAEELNLVCQDPDGNVYPYHFDLARRTGHSRNIPLEGVEVTPDTIHFRVRGPDKSSFIYSYTINRNTGHMQIVETASGDRFSMQCSLAKPRFYRLSSES